MTSEEREELKAYFDGKFHDVNKRLDGIDKRLDGIDKRFDGIDKRLDGIDGRLDGIDKRLDGIDLRLDGMDKRFDGIDLRLDGMDKRFDGLDGRLDGMDKRFVGIDKRLGDIDVHLDRQDAALEQTTMNILLTIEAESAKVRRYADGLFATVDAPLRTALASPKPRARPKRSGLAPRRTK